MEHAVAMFALTGSGPTPDLARLVIANLPAIERFLERHPRPFLAKVLPPPTPRRAGPSASVRPSAGSVKMWLTEAEWRAER